MSTIYRPDVEVDDQAPAYRRVSAYRRCKEMNPRWMVDESVGKPSVTSQKRSETGAGSPQLLKFFSKPPMH